MRSLRALIVRPGGRLAGKVRVDGDKSISHRALLFSGLATGKSTITHALQSEDTAATAGILRALGVKIASGDQSFTVESPGLHGFQAPKEDLDCGNSGTTARLCLGILAAQRFSSRLFGDASLSRRPMARIMDPLRRMGATFTSEEGGLLPITVNPAPADGLVAITYDSPVASAQVKSACLLAGLYARGTTVFSEPRISRDHTERILSTVVSLKKSVLKNSNPSRLQMQFRGPLASLEPRNWVIPGDLSSAAFFIVGALIASNSEIVLQRVGVNPTRLGICEALRDMGANIEMGETEEVGGEPVANLTVRATSLSSHHMHGDQTLRALDEIPIWAVAAALSNGTSVLADAQELRVKESDRLETVRENLRRLGVSVESTGDGLVIPGRPQGFLHPAESGYGPGYLESFGDHRLAMAMAIAALRVQSKDGLTPTPGVEIRNTACIATSFPGFIAAFRTLAGADSLQESSV